MKKILTLLVCVLTAFGFAGCAGEDKMSFTDFAGMRIGVIEGNLAEAVIRNDMGATPVLYSDMDTALEDIRNGEINGFISDLSIVQIAAGTNRNSDMQVVPVPAEVFAGSIGAFSSEQAVVDRFNTFLAGIKADGTLADMQERWFDPNPLAPSPIVPIEFTGEETEILYVATAESGIPFSYRVGGGRLHGYSIELAQRFAASQGMGVQFATMEFNELIPFVSEGEADLGIDAVTITEERARLVTFTEPFYEDYLGIITLK
jgi:polar amino acid transport system substrate-binding protein